MKRFDVSAYGVEEMTKKEMQETNGGFFGWMILGLVALAALFCTKWIGSPTDDGGFEIRGGR